KTGLVIHVAAAINMNVQIELMVRMRRTPCIWTRWPITRKAVSDPIVPIVRREPNSALLKPRFRFTSTKRVTQLIIPRPKRKCRVEKRRTCPGVTSPPAVEFTSLLKITPSPMHFSPLPIPDHRVPTLQKATIPEGGWILVHLRL
ncbi:MAG: hypothetical protein RIS22_1044, partial [Actinomycetota bacterium]